MWMLQIFTVWNFLCIRCIQDMYVQIFTRCVSSVVGCQCQWTNCVSWWFQLSGKMAALSILYGWLCVTGWRVIQNCWRVVFTAGRSRPACSFLKWTCIIKQVSQLVCCESFTDHLSLCMMLDEQVGKNEIECLKINWKWCCIYVCCLWESNTKPQAFYIATIMEDLIS